VIIDNQTPYLIHLVSSRNVVHASVKMQRRALTALSLSLSIAWVCLLARPCRATMEGRADWRRRGAKARQNTRDGGDRGGLLFLLLAALPASSGLHLCVVRVCGGGAVMPAPSLLGCSSEARRCECGAWRRVAAAAAVVLWHRG